MMNIAITGDTGFVGCHLREYLSNQNITPISLSRSNTNWQSTDDLAQRLTNVNCVVHLAGVAHNPKATYEDYHEGNVQFTESLCQQIANANNKGLSEVRKIVMISSIKAMGEYSETGKPLRYNDPCHPQDNYGKTKLAAENALKHVCDNANIQWSIIRPPLVFSPSARGNLALIQTIAKKGIPIPLGGIDNRRDLVSIRNLCRLILAAATNPKSNQQTFLVSDGKALSTPEIILQTTKTLTQPPRIIALPHLVRAALTKYRHANGLLERLFGNLEVDIKHTCETLNWTPTQEP